MIADIHCHYPMHLLPQDRDPDGPKASWTERIRDVLQADTEGLLARIINDRKWDSGWRISLDGLQAGGAGIVCSVLYWPPAEFDFDRRRNSPPLPAYYQDLEYQMRCVAADLRRQDPSEERVIVARKPADLDDERIVFVHCVEGGLHLGPEEDQVDARVGELAAQGVVYITLAHLFFRGVATNAPAIPIFSDRAYNDLFPQPREGLTSLGRAAVRAMYKHKVLIDVSHMRQDAIDETFALVEELDATLGRELGRGPRDFPLIATHVGMRSAERHNFAYNLDADTAMRIQRRGGLIGLIMAERELGRTWSARRSRAVLRKHINAIAALGNGHAATALGSDLDGFIKPTLKGVQDAADLKRLEQWIRDDFPGDADAILHENARRVLKRALAGRP